MKLKVYDLSGKATSEITLAKEVFGVKVNQPLLKQAIRVYQNNARSTAAVAKTRSQVNRTGAKAYRQKGTGNARHGSKRAPIFVGGGKAHGPKYDQYTLLKLTKKMKKSALVSALTVAFEDKKIICIDGLESIKKPSTKKIVKLLGALDLLTKKVSFVITNTSNNAQKSIRNIDTLKFVFTEEGLNALSVLKSGVLIFDKKVLKSVNNRLK